MTTAELTQDKWFNTAVLFSYSSRMRKAFKVTQRKLSYNNSQRSHFDIKEGESLKE